MSIELADSSDVVNPNVFLRFNGKDKPSYRCACGANVFSKLTPISEGWERYRCNGCGQELEAA
jgi:predicted SprT family Zn-dependent metalloprotease